MLILQELLILKPTVGLGKKIKQLNIIKVFIIAIIAQITMSNTVNQDQAFSITEKPVAYSVHITVLDVYGTINNGFKEIYFEGEEGKEIVYNHSKLKEMLIFFIY